jgi:hypothetical protein
VRTGHLLSFHSLLSCLGRLPGLRTAPRPPLPNAAAIALVRWALGHMSSRADTLLVSTDRREESSRMCDPKEFCDVTCTHPSAVWLAPLGVWRPEMARLRRLPLRRGPLDSRTGVDAPTGPCRSRRTPDASRRGRAVCTARPGGCPSRGVGLPRHSGARVGRFFIARPYLGGAGVAFHHRPSVRCGDHGRPRLSRVLPRIPGRWRRTPSSPPVSRRSPLPSVSW